MCSHDDSNGAVRKIVFFGTPEFALPSLKLLVDHGFSVLLVVTQPDRAKGRGRKIKAPAVKRLATELGIEVYQPEKLKNRESIERVIAARPDILVVVAYGQLVPYELIEKVPLGAVNVHPSLLPKYRGAAPIQRAIMNGDTKTGVTTMFLDEGMDSGPILLQEEVDIDEKDSFGDLHDRLAQKGAELLVETLARLSANTLEAKPQDESKATFAPMIQKEECEVDWSRSAWDIANLIRALDPVPGAFTYWDNALLKVFRPRVEAAGLDEAPGTVIEVAPHGLLVVAGDGVGLRIEEVQLAGYKRMRFSEFSRGKGRTLKVRDWLGRR